MNSRYLLQLAVLLEENAQLNAELREMQRMHASQLDQQQATIAQLQASVDGLKSQHEDQAEEKRVAVDDHLKHIDALEKQLAATKQFLEEQTAEREQEREEFQMELEQLKECLKDRDKQDSNNQRLLGEVSGLRLLLSS